MVRETSTSALAEDLQIQWFLMAVLGSASFKTFNTPNGQGDFNFSFGGGPASPVLSDGSAGFGLY